MRLVRSALCFASAPLIVSLAACSSNPAVPNVETPSTKEAFGGVQCSAVRPQTEPDLMGWDAGSRANLNLLRNQGVVAVRYHADGCNVELEILSNCIGAGTYSYSPYAATDTKTAHDASELFAALPIGAARLSGKVKNGRALRTDYMLAGVAALPAGSTFEHSGLRGSDCARATHVVNKIYVGGFGMMAGESKTIDAAATVFGADVGGTALAQAERVATEGNADACQEAQGTGLENRLCAVPLRIGLLPLAPDVPPPPRGDAPPPRAAAQAEGDPSDVVHAMPIGDAPVRGPATAPVTIVAFGGYQCPFTKRVKATLDRLRGDYGGKVRVVWRDSPLEFHERAMPAAELARAARAQRGDAGFWRVHDLLFASPRLDDGALESIAREAGLDVRKAMASVAARSHKRGIEADLKLAADFDARGTPSFFINGRILVGAQPIETFEAMIDEELRKADALVRAGTPPTKIYEALTKNGRAPR